MRSNFLTFSLLLALAASAAACNLPRAAQAPAVTPEAVYTQAAQTIVAGLTRAAPPSTPVFTPTAAATDTPGALPTAAQLPSDTPAATPSATPTTAPTASPAAGGLAATPTQPAQVLFEDDFSSGRGWYTTDEADFTFRFVDEAYAITVNLVEAFVWSVRSAGADDVILEVDAARAAGPQDGWYGLVCRHQDSDNYYALVIAGDGSFAVVRFLDGEREFLQEGSAPAGLIHSQDGVNRLRAGCVGDRLSLYANGQQLAELQDDSLETGEVGLAAGTRDQDGLEARFDNFVIYAP